MKKHYFKRNFIYLLGLLSFSAVKPIQFFWRGDKAEVKKLRSQWFYRISPNENFFVKKGFVKFPDESLPIRIAQLQDSENSKNTYFVLAEDYAAIAQKIECVKQTNQGFFKDKYDFALQNKENYEKALYLSPECRILINELKDPQNIVNNHWLEISKIYQFILNKNALNNFFLAINELPSDMVDFRWQMDCFSLRGPFAALKDDKLYSLPRYEITRPIALSTGYFGLGCLFKVTFYNWFLSRPVNYFFGHYILTWQVFQKIRKMIAKPKHREITYGKELDKKLKDLAEKMKALKRIPGKGLVLHGKPGNGKTLFFEQLANLSGAIWIKIDPFKILVPVSDKDKNFSVEKSLGAIFDVAKFYRHLYKRPVMIFWDELDAFFKQRKTSKDVTAESIVNALLKYLAELDPASGIYFCGATNHLGSIDSAALRSGRMGGIIEVKNPEIEDITALVNQFFVTQKTELKMSRNVLDYISKISLGLSRADISSTLEMLMEEIDLSWAGKKLTPDQENEIKKLFLGLVNDVKASIASQEEARKEATVKS